MKARLDIERGAAILWLNPESPDEQSDLKRLLEMPARIVTASHEYGSTEVRLHIQPPARGD